MVTAQPVIVYTDAGLYCPLADVYIDPWRRVSTAIITHAHSDHARPGMGRYIAHRHSAPLLRHRLGKNIRIHVVDYGEPFDIRGVRFSLHPAGHILGSAQIRVETDNDVWVVSGDYKRHPDPLAAPFEVVPCSTFITECTFGQPVYSWQSPDEVLNTIVRWAQRNAAQGVSSVVLAYSLGKAQRLFLELVQRGLTVFVHPTIEAVHTVIRNHILDLPASPDFPTETSSAFDNNRATVVIAPSSALRNGDLAPFAPFHTADVSGWMALRESRQRRGASQGFALSDHVDWHGILQTIKDTGCSRVYAMHGDTRVLVRYLRERGYEADGMVTPRRTEADHDDIAESMSDTSSSVSAAEINHVSNADGGSITP